MRAKSSLLSLIFFGDSYTDIWTPWSVFVDVQNQWIEVSKRNVYLIGVDKRVIPFRNIRNIVLDQHLIGADLFFKVYGGNVIAKCIPKKQAQRIYELGLQEISNKKSSVKLV